MPGSLEERYIRLEAQRIFESLPGAFPPGSTHRSMSTPGDAGNQPSVSYHLINLWHEELLRLYYYMAHLHHQGILFPSAIVRVNKALPDQVYTSGSHVILSDSDSMFFQWHLGRSRFTSCYIGSIVPTVEDGLAANKSYTSSGPIPEIQIWNVTTPAEGMMGLSWNTRPQRIALIGTVAFLPEKEKIEWLGLEDGWQSQLATRFSCGEEASVITVEIAYNSGRIEFEQLFSVLLAFDLMEIG